LPGRMSTPLIFMVHLEMMEKEPVRHLAALGAVGKPLKPHPLGHVPTS